MKPFLEDYSDVYILVTGDIKVVGGDVNTNVAFKNCGIFIRLVIPLNDEHIDTRKKLDLTMGCLYNLISYSDNYADTTASLYHYKRAEQAKINNVIVNLVTNT